jgi:hypothetical protein
VWVHVCMCACVYVGMHVCVRACMYARMSAHAYALCASMRCDVSCAYACV